MKTNCRIFFSWFGFGFVVVVVFFLNSKLICKRVKKTSGYFTYQPLLASFDNTA